MLLGKILVTKEILKEEDLHQMLAPQERGEHLRHLLLAGGGLPVPRRRPAPRAPWCRWSWTSPPSSWRGCSGSTSSGASASSSPRRTRSRCRSTTSSSRAWTPGEQQILELVRRRAHGRGDPPADALQRVPRLARCSTTSGRQGRLKVVKPRWREHTGTFVAAPTNGGTLTGDALLEAGRKYLEEQDFEHALRHLRAARSLEPESQDIQDALTQGEKAIREEIEAAGVTLASVPQLAVSMDQLTTAKLSPQEGFMLTRHQRQLRHPVDPEDHPHAPARRPAGLLEAPQGGLHQAGGEEGVGGPVPPPGEGEGSDPGGG